jgi:2-phospho-L-lactate/phosphoenolpyruvate guanylyltransferase
MNTWAIIPVKPLRESKRRLERLLSTDERADLILHILGDLLATLDQVGEVDRILVVTGDPAVTALAHQRQINVLDEATTAGLNEAVSRGIAKAQVGGATAALILPADLPFARVEDIEQVLATYAPEDAPMMAICGDEIERGTNALFLAPPGGFTFHYGEDSYQAHLAEARRCGRTIFKVRAPGLRFDLDTEDDWLVYNGQLDRVAGGKFQMEAGRSWFKEN